MVQPGIAEHLKELDLSLLPEDKRFVSRILKSQPEWIIKAALQDYKNTWIEAESFEPIEHKKDNAGRRAANIFLRTVIWPSLYDSIKSAA